MFDEKCYPGKFPNHSDNISQLPLSIFEFLDFNFKIAGRSPRLLATSTSVAFHAFVSHDVQHVEEGQTVLFDSVHLNV